MLKWDEEINANITKQNWDVVKQKAKFMRFLQQAALRMLEKMLQKQETEDNNAFEEMKKEIERRYSWNGETKILCNE